MSRYDGKPFLRLIEDYVLEAIGRLNPERRSGQLDSVEPKLRELYRRDGSWFDIVAAEMRFPANMPSLIRGVWEKNQKLAEQNGEHLVPEDFARMFVDANIDTNTVSMVTNEEAVEVLTVSPDGFSIAVHVSASDGHFPEGQILQKEGTGERYRVVGSGGFGSIEWHQGGGRHMRLAPLDQAHALEKGDVLKVRPGEILAAATA